MIELKTNEFQTAVEGIKKKISEKQNEKRNLESQKSKLEFSIRSLQDDVDKLQEELKNKRREYYNNLLAYAKEKIEALNPESY
jgi:peptidoglycan hydrolase CwlO-like protein